MYQVTQAVNQTIFNESLVDQATDPKQLDRQLVTTLKEKRDEYDRLHRDHQQMPYATHLATVRDAIDEILALNRMKERFQAIIEQADELQTVVDTAVQLGSFIEDNGPTYRALRDFVSRKQGEFDLLEPEDREVAEKLRSYVRSDDRPDQDFRRMKQYYESIRDALNERVGKLRTEAEEAYEEAFDELEQYRTEQGVDDVLPERKEVLSRIRRTDDPNRLEAETARVSDFKTEYRIKLRDAAERQKAEQKQAEQASSDGDDPSVDGPPPAPKTTEAFSVSEVLGQRDIESEEDIDHFLQDLRRELVQRVNDDKIIVIS